MKSDRRAPVAIIGGGFSGTMLAAQLARRGINSLLIEGSGRGGLGTAYSTEEPAHVLNVRAEGMSAWPDDPGHFANAFGDPRGFAERKFFGRYLRSILDEAVKSGHVQLVVGQAVQAALGPEGWQVELDDGGKVEAQAVVLAIGNQPPEPLGIASGLSGRFINNPWGDEAKSAVREAASSGGDVLLIGTGLTMIDAVLSLNAAGHQGRIVALSRRGQVPRAHADFAPAPIAMDEIPAGNVLALWLWLRRRSGEVGWRAAVDSLRPHSQALWQGLSDGEQRRFLRHARPWWDVHRHRIAPQVTRQVHDRVAEGKLEIVAGRLGAMRAVDSDLEVEVQRRGGSVETRRFAFAINCTGPLGNIERTRDAMLRGLLDAGLVRPDPLGIGLAVDQDSRAIGADRLWALGPLTKGRYWEIVAVPDIREQAAAVAGDIAMELEK
ncbi:MAG: FAD/NAD(P)-binding protein [Sphingomicrobium sp.]